MAIAGRRQSQNRASAEGAPSRAAGSKPGYVVPSANDVVAAAESLYADRLLPLGRILLKRIRELSVAAAASALSGGDVDADSAPLIDPKGLRRVCEACERLRVKPEEGKEFSVLIAGRLPNFVDVNSATDCYPAAMWEQLVAYLENLPPEDAEFPGGRYACAQVLAGHCWPFLEVCHIVQLALSQKNLLGYMGGSIVPFGQSLENVKRQFAARQQAVMSMDKTHATWEEAREGLRVILRDASHDGQPGAITLSNVKRFFRMRVGLGLSETVLGYGRMSELLQDPHFGEICHLEVRDKVQFVVGRAAAASAVAARQVAPTPHVGSMRTIGCASHPEAREPLTMAAKILSGHVQELLELGLEARRDALRALSEYKASTFVVAEVVGFERLESVARPGAMSRCSSTSASCSAGDGSAWCSDDDSASGAWSERRLSGGSAAAQARPPPGLPPPGLAL